MCLATWLKWSVRFFSGDGCLMKCLMEWNMDAPRKEKPGGGQFTEAQSMHTLIRSTGRVFIPALGSNYAFKPTAVPALGFDRDLSCRAMLST